ncbi:MAG: nucleoside deaminase [Nitrospirae bacterium]|nr:MAG: nucleoside deaminase [Nitrospirota bacterium]
MAIALLEAEKAFKIWEVPIGAVLVREGRMISKAHNMCESLNDPTAHAEMLIIRDGASILNNWRLKDCTIYVTKEPCIMCAGAMINARIYRIVYGCSDKKGGAVHSLYHLLNDERLNHQVLVTKGVMENECSSILREFFTKLRYR